jgi:hypothetical protein
MIGRISSIIELVLATIKYIRSAKQDDIYGASNIVLPCPVS